MMGPLPPSLVIWGTSSRLPLRPAAAADALGQPGDGGQALKGLGAFALVHDMQDFIHEAVQADKGAQGGGAGGGGEEFLGAGGAKFRCVHGG